jgi:hypothetical protein
MGQESPKIQAGEMMVPHAQNSDRAPEQRGIREGPKTESEMEYGKGRSRYAIDQNRCC